jgi:hypothetical protein
MDIEATLWGSFGALFTIFIVSIARYFWFSEETHAKIEFVGARKVDTKLPLPKEIRRDLKRTDEEIKIPDKKSADATISLSTLTVVADKVSFMKYFLYLASF